MIESISLVTETNKPKNNHGSQTSVQCHNQGCAKLSYSDLTYSDSAGLYFNARPEKNPTAAAQFLDLNMKDRSF